MEEQRKGEGRSHRVFPFAVIALVVLVGGTMLLIGILTLA